MDAYIREKFAMGFEKVEELLHGKMEIPTMVSGEVVCRMDLEKINGEMGPKTL